MPDTGGFDTAAIRDAVLTAWRASPERFREDANAEEDLAHGHYRDRTVIELLQNAADAAGGGSALIRLTTGPDPMLVVGNTGQPLTEAGVRALAGLRASTKTAEAGTIGSFGVGFAAVRAVSDDITVRSRTGAVRFAVGPARQEMARLARVSPEIAEQLAARSDRVAALRLPFDAPDASWLLPDEAPWATEVQLRLVPDAAAALLDQLAELTDLTLLALPGLVRLAIEIDGRRRELTDPARGWWLATETGRLPEELARQLAVEQRGRTAWRVTWALPRAASETEATPMSDHLAGAAGLAPQPILAPTPTDDRITLPARLVASLPLDATRRRIPRGPVTDLVLAQAARCYAQLAARRAADDVAAALPLIPTGLPAGEIDAALHELILAALRDAPILAGPPGGPRLAPRDAVLLPPHLWERLTDGEAARIWAALGEFEPRLTRLVGPDARRAAPLGLESADLADLVDRVPAGWSAARLGQLYRDLAPLARGGHGEDLATLPVRLADGTIRRGVRGALLTPASDEAAHRALALLAAAGLRIADPALATGPAAQLLAALGARPVTTRELLDLPELAAVIDACPDEELDELTEALLTLVAQTDPEDDEPAFDQLGRLPLRAIDGAVSPAEDLVLPGTVAAQLFDDELLAVHPGLIDRWGSDVLAAIGVRTSLTLLTGADRALADGWDDFEEEAQPGDEDTAVGDLDLIRPDAWPLALREVAHRPRLRAAVLASPRSYLSWWLSERRRPPLPTPFAIRDEPPGLPPRPAELASIASDEPLLAALGGVTGLGELTLDQWRDLVQRANPAVAGEPAEPEVAAAWWRALAALARCDQWPNRPPEYVPALLGGRPVWCRSGDVVVADGASWLQLAQLGPMVPTPPAAAAEVAELIEAPLASERTDAEVWVESPTEAAVPSRVRLLLPAAPERWWECDRITVGGRDVTHWVSDGTVIHACTLAGLAQSLAECCGEPAFAPAIEVLLGADDGDAAAATAAWWAAVCESDSIESGQSDGAPRL